MSTQLTLLIAALALTTLTACTGLSEGNNTSINDAHTVNKLPAIVAHRAGTADNPENTLPAITAALNNGADAIWLSVQISKDGTPMLYRPTDLNTLTNSTGTIASKTAAELQTLNAGWQFSVTATDGSITYPWRTQTIPIPTLDQALQLIPSTVPVILDMKALPAPEQAAAVAQVLDAQRAWDRVTLYSTEAAYQDAFAPYRQAQLYESRDATRGRLANVDLGAGCTAAPANTRAAFEMTRAMDLTENFTLGTGHSPVNARLWTPTSVQCFRQNSGTYLLGIAVNNIDDYKAAACLGLDAAMVDSPANMVPIRASITLPLQCPATN